jgi:ATP-dependent DNA helicase RecQ
VSSPIFSVRDRIESCSAQIGVHPQWNEASYYGIESPDREIISRLMTSTVQPTTTIDSEGLGGAVTPLRSSTPPSLHQPFPGAAVDPAGWSEPWDRQGRQVRFTTIGCRARGSDLPMDPHITHALSAVMVVSSVPSRSPTADVGYWITLCRRLLQRGTLPLVKSDQPDAWPVLDAQIVESLFAASTQLPDEAVVLDERYERRFFADARNRYPLEANFLVPQAPFESAGQGQRDATTRWIDFLYAPPQGPRTALEIDGSQHQKARAADRARDATLSKRGIATVRAAAEGRTLDPTPLFDVLRRSPVGEGLADCRAVRSCINAVRLAYALVEAVAVGALEPSSRWTVEVQATDIDEAVLSDSLVVLAALDAIWETEVMPSTISFRGDTSVKWSNPYASCSKTGECSTTLRVDWGAAWADLSPCPSAGVTVRGIPIPAHAGWDPPLSTQRRSLDAASASRPEVEAALTDLARYVFGIQAFRPGQVRAIRRILVGGDSLVLLPTGSGKSLIYQIGILLRPGTTLVIDPIKALIDDQDRRFHDEGIDRVVAIHSGRGFSVSERDTLNRSIARGNALIALVSPERLQVAGFRDALLTAATDGLVNMAVIDEAHCVSEWGHDFRTSYLRLARNVRRYGRDITDQPPPLLALTGTASPAVLRDVINELGIDDSEPDALQRPDQHDRPNLHFEIVTGGEQETFALLDRVVRYRIPDALGRDLVDLTRLDGELTPCGITFVPWSSTTGDFGVTNVQTKILAAFKSAEVPAPTVEVYSGAMQDDVRANVATAFRRNAANVLVATKAFGMGIDKPNIRWTAHIGIPSSIEGFVQEAGRAGRDGQPAHCVIVSARPNEDVLRPHLDVSVPPRERRASFLKHQGRLGDVGRQLFFLYNSFPGSKYQDEHTPLAVALRTAWHVGEVRQVHALYDQLLAEGAGPLATITIPRIPPTIAEYVQQTQELKSKDRADILKTSRELVDKALHRLSTVGVVDDLTIDYGADTVTLEFGRYTTESIDESVLRFANQTMPGRYRVHAEAVASAPSELDERVKHHLKLVVSLTYQVIEPARLNALSEMWRLTLGSPTDETIRGTIASYLGGGPTSVLLSDLVTSPTIDVKEVLNRLTDTARGDEYDWAGASARLLEAYPGNPILLFVRASGEAFLPQGTVDGFGQYIEQLAGSFSAYSIDADGQRALFQRLSDLLRNARQGTRTSWVRALWTRWASVTGPCQALDDAAALALAMPADVSPDELDMVLSYRLQRDHERSSLPTVFAEMRNK